MYRRNLQSQLRAALADTPVAMVSDVRLTGKTTLIEQIARQREATYATLDDAATLTAATADPAGLLSG